MNTAFAALNQYQQVKTSAISDASPHQLIKMLMATCLQRLAEAKGCMQRRDIPNKGDQIGKAMAIIAGLREVLDFERGGEIARNLDALYDYMTRQLLKANIDNDITIIDEVSGLLQTIKEGWDAIEPH